jgi:D-glycero-D-manno-heptose 1,7-bisphosphate phosphatase
MQKRGLLLDRDGVINIDRGYVGHLDAFEFIPGVFPFLLAVQDLGFRLAILTNQSGVARGYYTAKDHEHVTEHMLKELAKRGVMIDLVLACFEHKEGTVERYARDSFWRKPNPGMVIDAIQRLQLDPSRSAFLGDHMRDMEAAWAGGIRQCLLLTTESVTTTEGITQVHDYHAALKALT